MKRLLIPVVSIGVLALGAQAAALGLGAGVVQIEDADSSQLWVTANVRLPVGENFALEPEVGWYRESEDEVTLDVINLGGNALFVYSAAEQVELWAGGGAGAHTYRVSVGDESESETRLGIHFLGGVDLKLSDSLKLFGAIRYEIIQADESFHQWKLYAGLRFGG